MQGIEIYNEIGLPVLSVTDSLTKIIGSVSISNGVNGSVYVPEAGSGGLYFAFVPYAFDYTGALFDLSFPRFSQSGSYIIWEYQYYFIAPEYYRYLNGDLIYGWV